MKAITSLVPSSSAGVIPKSTRLPIPNQRLKPVVGASRPPNSAVSSQGRTSATSCREASDEEKMRAMRRQARAWRAIPQPVERPWLGPSAVLLGPVRARLRVGAPRSDTAEPLARRLRAWQHVIFALRSKTLSARNALFHWPSRQLVRATLGFGAGDGNRTHDIQLGKLSFYH